MLKPVPPTMVDTTVVDMDMVDSVDTDTVDTTVTDMADTVALTDMEDTTTARGPLMPNQRPQLKPHPKPRLMPKLPLMPTTDTTAVDTDTVTDTVLVTDTDTVLDTAVTTVMVVSMADTVADTDTDTDTTTARGPLMPNPLLKPHPRSMLKPLLTMVDTTVTVDTVMVDTAVDTHTVMANRNCFRLEYLAIFLIPPFGAFETYTTALCNITETVFFFMKKLLQNSYLDPIVIKNSQKMPISKKWDPCNIIRTALRL